MFRTVLELTLSVVEKQHGVDSVRKNLYTRLQEAFAQGYLPKRLEELAKCIREDGNVVAHEGPLMGSEDASDILDFAVAVLEEVFTSPQDLNLKLEARDRRRSSKTDE